MTLSRWPLLVDRLRSTRNCAKIALYGKNCALHQQCPNCGKIVRRKIAIFWRNYILYLTALISLISLYTICVMFLFPEFY